MNTQLCVNFQAGTMIRVWLEVTLSLQEALHRQPYPREERRSRSVWGVHCSLVLTHRFLQAHPFFTHPYAFPCISIYSYSHTRTGKPISQSLCVSVCFAENPGHTDHSLHRVSADVCLPDWWGLQSRRGGNISGESLRQAVRFPQSQINSGVTSVMITH